MNKQPIKDIEKLVHDFTINEEGITVEISFINGVWRSELIKGDTGVRGTSGGTFDSLEEYIEAVERQHTHAYGFFKKGV
jgi:hypothetical protein